MPDASKQSIKLFYCYAREDRDLRDQFEKALSGLKRYYRLGNWYDREILAGQNWEEAIAEQLNSANVIFLLISPDFIASDYCYGIEMQRALERHAEGSCLVIPILLRPTHWKGTPFGTLQLLPTNARPITRWPDRDDAFEDVVKEVSRSIEELLISLKTKQDWLVEGIASRKQKQYSEALEAFEQAIILDPNYLEAYQEKGLTLHGLNRHTEALEALEEALRLNPNLVELSITRGQILHALERYEEALTAFEQAIHLDPSLVNAYIGRHKALQKLGISKEAQEQLTGQLQHTQQELVDQQKRFEQLENQLAKTQQQKDETQEQLASQLEEALQLLAIQQKRSEQLENDLRQARQELSTLQKQSKDFEGQLQETRQQRDQAQEQLALSQKLLEQLESQRPSGTQTNQSQTSERSLQKTGQQSTTQQKQPERSQAKKMLLNAAAKTDVGRQAELNADSPYAYISEEQERGLFIIADGTAGYHSGEVASRLAVQKISEALKNFLAPLNDLPTVRLTPLSDADISDMSMIKLDTSKSSEQTAKAHRTRKMTERPTIITIEDYLKLAFRQANRAIVSYGEEISATQICTVTSVLVQDQQAFIVNVGKNRAYLFRNGELMVLTRDHSLVQRLVEEKQIEPEEVYTHPQRNLIYRYLGTEKSSEPDVFHQPLHDGDILLLCSDGLWEMVRHHDLWNVLKQKRDPQHTCDKLIDMANANGGEDNITAIVVQVQSDTSAT